MSGKVIAGVALGAAVVAGGGYYFYRRQEAAGGLGPLSPSPGAVSGTPGPSGFLTPAELAARFNIPLATNTQGQVAFFYAGQWNGVPQVAKYSANGNLELVYSDPGLAGQTSPLGSVIGGTYRAPGTFTIPG